MPKIKSRKTYLEQVDPTPVMSILRFLHTGRYSPLVRAMRYALLGLCGDIEADVEARDALNLSEQVTDESLFSLEKTRNQIRGRLDKQEWSRRLLPYLKDYAREGVPFSHFEDEPAPVSQLKKIINALYHTEEALKIAESIDIEGLSLEEGNTAPETLSKLWGPFVDHVYELCMLVTHTDVDLTAAFGDEWHQINALIFNLIQEMPEKYLEQSSFFSKEYGLHFDSPKAVAGHLGHWTGATLQGLKPTRILNYSTVSYFGADVSTYLNRLTKFIQDTANRYFTAPYLNQDGAKVESYEISKVRLRELEQASIKLEKSLKSLTSQHGVLQYFNVYALLNIVRNTSTLVQSVIEESGHFRAESEELVRAALAQLKYQLFLELVKAVDKIEEEAVTQPGLRSIELVGTLDEFYGFLFSYVNGFVDLSARGQDLSRLVDSRFVELRQQAFYERQAEREKSLVEHRSKERIVDEFFELLSQYRGRRLSQLSLVEKNELLDLFSVIQPLIAQDDISLSNTIANALLPKQNEPEKPEIAKAPASLGERVLDGLIYAGTQAYYGLTSAYRALDQSFELPRRYLGDYADRVELLDEGYTFELLQSYTVSIGEGYAPEFNPSDYMPGATFFSNRIYVKVIEGKIALSIKKPNGTFFSHIKTPFDAPDFAPLSPESLKPLESDLLHFAREQGLIGPSLHQRIKQTIKKEEATCLFRSQINADCRAKIYESSGELLQQRYSEQQDAYIVDESQILGIADALPINLSEIDSQHLLKLYRAYLVASSKLDDAESSMAFFRMLETYPLDKTLSSISQKNELRHLYTAIQPYLISSLRKIKSPSFAAEFDKCVIDAFSGRTTRGKALSIGEILSISAPVLDDFQRSKNLIDHRKEEIHASIESKASVDRVEQLLIDNPHGTRTSYVVKDPQYTRYIQDLVLQLEEYTRTLFSLEVQKKLVVQTQPISGRAISLLAQLESRPQPFPEANELDDLSHLKQERQVLGLKRFYNCVHELREVAIQLEELNEDSYKTKYVWRSIMLEEHLRRAVILYQQISEDEYLNPLVTELRQSIAVIINSFQTLTSPYAPKKADKDANIDAAHDAIFYIVNGLVIGREQIDAWQKGNYISDETAQEAQVFSEQISKDVRGIVEANSYLQWVLQSETFYHLFYDLKDRWNKFAASSTNAIEANLESIYTQNFTDILIQADEWERKLGLNAGLISGPLKNILDAYYFGMVDVLRRDIGHEISLATTQVPFNRRQQSLSCALETEKQGLDDAERNLALIRGFKVWVNRHPEMMPLVWQNPEIEGQKDYQTFLVLLQQLSSIESMNLYLKDLIEPKIFSVILLERAPELDEIPACQEALRKLIDVCEARFEGDRNTAQLSVKHCYLQQDHLRDALAQQETKNREMKNALIKKLIFKTLVNYQSGEKRLLFVRDLYDNALKEEIETHVDDFLKGLSEHQSIEKQVRAFLNNKVKAFDDEHLVEFQQFNELHFSLSELESYIHSQSAELTKANSSYRHTWALENTGTLALKSRLHQSLTRILKGKKTSNSYNEPDIADEVQEEGEALFDPNDKWHIKARMDLFRGAVESPRFRDALLKTEDTYKISPLSWLIQWFVGLLRVFGVYKTESEVIHEHLQASTQKKSTTVILGALSQGTRAPIDASSLSRPEDQDIGSKVSPVSMFNSSKQNVSEKLHEPSNKKTPGSGQR